MPWHNNSIKVQAVETTTAALGDNHTETPGASLGANGTPSKDVRLEAPNSCAEVSRERPVAIVFGMMRSPRMKRFGDNRPTQAVGAEEVGSPHQVLASKQNATTESSNTKIALENAETSPPIPKSVGESRTSRPCVCGSSYCQSVEEVMTLPIILQWKGDCFSSAPAPPARVKSEVFCGGTMKTFSSYSEDSLDVVLRETLV